MKYEACVCRQQAKIDEDDRKTEDRLLERAWRLMRAGRVLEARRLCEESGQYWRSASLGGGGKLGPLPLGAAAILAENDPSHEEEGLEEVALETESGESTLRALWRWSCFQVLTKCILRY